MTRRILEAYCCKLFDLFYGCGCIVAKRKRGFKMAGKKRLISDFPNVTRSEFAEILERNRFIFD